MVSLRHSKNVRFFLIVIQKQPVRKPPTCCHSGATLAATRANGSKRLNSSHSRGREAFPKADVGRRALPAALRPQPGHSTLLLNFPKADMRTYHAERPPGVGSGLSGLPPEKWSILNVSRTGSQSYEFLVSSLPGVRRQNVWH